MDKTKGPHPVEVHIGARLRIARTMIGMSQEKLGKKLGLNFQQIQKYEKGANRIGGSRLWEIALALEVPPAFFFDGLENTPAEDPDISGYANEVMTFASSKDGLRLITRFRAIRSEQSRQNLIDLMGSIADDEGCD